MHDLDGPAMLPERSGRVRRVSELRRSIRAVCCRSTIVHGLPSAAVLQSITLRPSRAAHTVPDASNSMSRRLYPRLRAALFSSCCARRSQRGLLLVRAIVRPPCRRAWQAFLGRRPRCSLAQCVNNGSGGFQTAPLGVRSCHRCQPELESAWLAQPVVTAAFEGRQRARGTSCARCGAANCCHGLAPFSSFENRRLCVSGYGGTPPIYFVNLPNSNPLGDISEKVVLSRRMRIKMKS